MTDQLPFRIGRHETFGPMLYIDAGTDPNDGAPLMLARAATILEVRLWEAGRYHALADLLRAQGIPVGLRKPSWWRRVLAWVTGHRPNR